MHAVTMECRAGCAACCFAISISSPLPGMPNGKRAGVRCSHLTADHRCALYGKPERPAVCERLNPTHEMCGNDAKDAYTYLARLERMTR